jgi:hypothetical protein
MNLNRLSVEELNVTNVQVTNDSLSDFANFNDFNEIVEHICDTLKLTIDCEGRPIACI